MTARPLEGLRAFLFRGLVAPLVVLLTATLPTATLHAEPPQAHCEGETVEFCGKSLPKSTTAVRCYKGRGTTQPPFDLTPLACLPELRELILVSGEIEFVVTLPLGDLAPLGTLEQLEELALDHTDLTDISHLQGLVRLRSLNLHHSQVRDIEPLAKMSRLQELDLSGTQVSDLTPLFGLRELTELDLAKAPVTDLRGLAAVKSLERLGLSEQQREALREQLDELQAALPALEVTDGRAW